jgi:hypothetical protein
MLLVILLAFGVGAASGAFAHPGNVVFFMLLGGVFSVALLLLLSAVLACIITVCQSIWRRTLASFGSRFIRNFQVSLKVVISGWTP